MIEVLVTLLILVGIFGAIVFLAVKRGLQMRELCDHGVETTGVVAEKRSVKAGSAPKRQKLVYRYTDSTGTSHEHTSIVTNEVFDQHDSGGPIQVVYSSHKPDVSAPLYLVEQCRAALKKG